MLTDRQMLQSIYQNAEMGRDGVAHVLPFVKNAALADLLTGQQTGYRSVCTQAAALLSEIGDAPEGAGRMAKVMSRVSSDVQALTDPSASHIAEMMIEGCTMGITQMVRQLHDLPQGDRRVRTLAEQQLHAAQDNIEALKAFL